MDHFMEELLDVMDSMLKHEKHVNTQDMIESTYKTFYDEYKESYTENELQLIRDNTHLFYSILQEIIDYKTVQNESIC